MMSNMDREAYLDLRWEATGEPVSEAEREQLTRYLMDVLSEGEEPTEEELARMWEESQERDRWLDEQPDEPDPWGRPVGVWDYGIDPEDGTVA